MIFRGVPDQIGRYQILSELGRGSMGHVYLALDPNIERRIALKILLPLLKVGAQEQAELRQRFLVEARAAGKLKHPGVVTLFDADTDPDTGLSFIAMEWIDGPSLDDAIRQSGTLPIPRALAIAEQVAHALEAAHQADLVHRDIKPANILLTATGEAKVTDFGIAKLASMSITATGWVPGSPFYMSPEQVRGQDIDGRSDVYSLGITLYQSLTGEVPFQSDSLAGVTYMILEVDPRPSQPLNPDISDQLAAVIQKSMEKAPEDRFQSALGFAEALRRVSSDTPWESEPASVRPVRASSPTQLFNGAPERERTGTVVLQATGTEGSGPLHQAVASGNVPTVPIHGSGEPGQGSWASASPLTRYALTAIGLLLLLFVGPVLRTSASQDQQAVPFLVEATEPFSYSSPRALDSVAPEQPVFEVSIELPPFEGEEEETPEPERALPTHTLEESAPAPSRTVASAASLPRSPVETAPAKVRAPARATRVRAAHLEVVFKNRLKGAEVAIWIDEEKIWSRTVAAPKSVFKRIIGRNVFTTLPISAGSHVIDVRVIGVEGKVDVVRRTEAKFVGGETKRLKVAMVPPKKLKLSWADQNNG